MLVLVYPLTLVNSLIQYEGDFYLKHNFNDPQKTPQKYTVLSSGPDAGPDAKKDLV